MNIYKNEEPIFSRNGFKPGDVFREYVWKGPFINAKRWQRVTDPDARHEAAKEYLPNPVNQILLSDFDKAIRAEIVLELLGGHVGTSNKRIRINENEWIQIPELETIGPEVPEAYMQQRYPIIPIPLEILKEGINTFELSSGKQIMNDFGWGQWIIYAVIFRIYYDKDKPHTKAVISIPDANKVFYDKLGLAISISKTAKTQVNRVDYIGYLEDFDYTGNGLYTEWHCAFRYGEMIHHIGTVINAPFEMVWDTAWIPDQKQPVKVIARITNSDGLTYITPVADNLKLCRTGKRVKLYKPYNTPYNWKTRKGHIHECNVNVVDDIEKACEARILLKSWAGTYCERININGLLIMDKLGKRYDYCYDEIEVPINLIKQGENTLSTFSTTKKHGIEVLWPGIALKIVFP